MTKNGENLNYFSEFFAVFSFFLFLAKFLCLL